MKERRIALMRLLDSRTKVTARELAERFKVSVRTIQRDLDQLQQAGFPLYAESGPHGGYRVLPNRILPPLQLNQTEALGLFLMLQLLEQIKDFPFAAVREHLAVQYFAELPADVQDQIQRLQDYLAFPLSRTTPSSPYTTAILEAALEQKEIRFQYASSGGKSTAKQAYPLGIYYANDLWYMPAMANERVLLYRVDRVLELETMELDHTRTAKAGQIEQGPVKAASAEAEAIKAGTLEAGKVKPAYVCGEESQAGAGFKRPTLKAWLNTRETRPGVKVVLHFTEFGIRLAADEPLFQPLVEDSWQGNVPPEEFRFLSRKLLGYGPDVQVLEPPELRDQMRSLLEASLSPYLD